MQRKQIILIVAILAVLGGAFGLYQFSRGKKDLATVKADLALQDAALIKAFVDNEGEANKQYLDKVIKVEGAVKEVQKNPEGLYTIYLGAAGGENGVACEMAKAHNESVASLKVGDKAAFQGKCAGFNILDVSLTECALIK